MHISAVHAGQTFDCEVCLQKFKSRVGLVYHKQSIQFIMKAIFTIVNNVKTHLYQKLSFKNISKWFMKDQNTLAEFVENLLEEFMD